MEARQIYNYDGPPRAVDKLRNYLKLRDISAKQLAQEAGLSVSALSRIMAGKRYPRYETMRQLASVTNGLVSVQDWDRPL